MSNSTPFSVKLPHSKAAFRLRREHGRSSSSMVFKSTPKNAHYGDESGEKGFQDAHPRQRPNQAYLKPIRMDRGNDAIHAA